MNKFNSILKDTIVIGFGNLFSKGIIFFLVPLQTAMMTTSEYGLAEMLFNLLNVIIPIFTLGISEAGMRFSIDKANNKKSVFFVVTILPLIGGIVLALILLPVYFLCDEYKQYFFQLFVLYFCFSLREIYLQFSKGINKLRLYSFGSICFAVLLFLFSYYFLTIKNNGVNGYLNSYILANLITVLYLIFCGKLRMYADFSIKYFDKDLFKSMILYSLPLVSNLLAWWITNLSNRYILAYYCSLNDVGIYSALAKFSLIISTVYGVFFQAWPINAAKNINMKNARNEFFTAIHDYFLFTVVLGSALFMMCSEPIAKIFIRGEFTESYQYLPGIVFMGTACCLPMYWGAIYGALKNTKGAFYSTMCGSITSIAFNFLLIPEYGIYGAVISAVISYCVVMIYRIIDINKIILIDLNMIKHLLGFLCLLIQVYVYIFSPDNIIIGNTFLMIILLVVYYKNFIGLLYAVKNLK